MYDVNIYTNCIDTQLDGFDKDKYLDVSEESTAFVFSVLKTKKGESVSKRSIQ